MFGRLTPAVKNLLMINVLLQIVQGIFNVDLNSIGGLRFIFSDHFLPFQFVTYMFLHGNFWHLLGNMFALFIFGPMLEMTWGSKRFIIFYFVTGIGAGILYSAINFYEINVLKIAIEEYIQNPDPYLLIDLIKSNSLQINGNMSVFLENFQENPDNPLYIQESIDYANSIYNIMINGDQANMVGASGSVFGILLAFGMLFPNTELMLLFPPIPIKAKYFVLFYGLYELYAGIKNAPGDNVAHYAHLGGMLFAFILIKLWENKTDRFY